ncbi:acyl carrier protein [Plantactinospora sp. WMMC1484]|uniref:acyl carrier protein n=1 Tax=Plantactinospora sp. WMMC1484 TaxID=3404122 RepID=UPI003BF609C8
MAPTTEALSSPRLTPAAKSKSIERFVELIGEVLGVDSVSPSQHFLDAGGDSLSMAIIIDWVAQEFSVEPELDWFFESETIGDVAERWWAKVEQTF